eukprot:scaffold489669_cov11-Prasinocladus_malaysianus.AAC.1
MAFRWDSTDFKKIIKTHDISGILLNFRTRTRLHVARRVLPFTRGVILRTVLSVDDTSIAESYRARAPRISVSC